MPGTGRCPEEVTTGAGILGHCLPVSGGLKQAAEVFPVARMQNCSLSLFDERNARLSLSYLPPRALGEKGQRLRAG